MIRLYGAAHLQAFIDAGYTTTSPVACASWRMLGNQLVTKLDESSRLVQVSSATPIDIVEVPDGLLGREVDYVSIVNSDSVAHDVTIQLVDGAGTTILMKVSLSASEALAFADGAWSVIDSTGSAK